MRYIPILIIMILAIAAYASGITKYFSLEELRSHHQLIKDFIRNHTSLAPFLFILFYIIITAMALPVDTLLALLAGFLFPEPCALIYVVVGASTGATLLFLAARSAFSDVLFKWAGPLLKKLEKGFKENAASYMLFLRLVPIFPFWLVNMSPAFFGVPLYTYYWTTLIGVIPYAFLVTQAGAGLSLIIDTSQKLTLDTIFNERIKIALIGLGLLSLLPICLKKYYSSNSTSSL